MNLTNQITREINLFGNALTGIYTMHNLGGVDFNPAAELPTTLFDDPVPIAGVVTPEKAKFNDKMRRALSNELGGRLLVSVYDIIRHTKYKDSSPEFRFLRHVRNGVAHNNKFQLSESGLSEGAAWRGNELTPEMNGEIVMTTFDSSGMFIHESEIVDGYMEAGDAKELCSDLLVMIDEQKCADPK